MVPAYLFPEAGGIGNVMIILGEGGHDSHGNAASESFRRVVQEQLRMS